MWQNSMGRTSGVEMKRASVKVAIRCAVVFGLLNGGAAAQTPQAPPATEPFKPTVGQSGKDVVWVPTPPELVEKMLDMAKVTPQDIVMDLGSGDGRNIIAAAKRGATRRSASNSTTTWSSSRARQAAAAGVGRQGDLHRRRHVRGGHLQGHGARAVPASAQSQQADAEVPGAEAGHRGSSAIPSRRKAGRPTKPKPSAASASAGARRYSGSCRPTPPAPGSCRPAS